MQPPSWILLALALPAISCGTTKGAKPHEMSAQAHEQTAQQHEAMAEHLEQAYDPQAVQETRDCSFSQRRVGGPCWTSVVNPTEDFLKQAQKHRKMAADHRAGSQALRDAEAQACAGVSETDRDISPFARREDIVRVEPLKQLTGRSATLVGAAVTFRPVPDLTVEWLQRDVDCHLARNAALGHNVPEMDYCPLVPNGVTASVKQGDDGELVVEVRSSDGDTANEVLRRAQLAATR